MNLRNLWKMFWKTRIFDDSMTANGNKLRTYRTLKKKYETDTYLFLDINKTLIKQFTQIKIVTVSLWLNWEDIIKLILTKGFVPCVTVELMMNIILLFYAPASTISGIKCLPIFLVFFHLFMCWLMRKSSFYLFQCKEYDIVEVIVRGVKEMYNRRNELIDK